MPAGSISSREEIDFPPDPPKGMLPIVLSNKNLSCNIICIFQEQIILTNARLRHLWGIKIFFSFNFPQIILKIVFSEYNVLLDIFFFILYRIKKINTCYRHYLTFFICHKELKSFRIAGTMSLLPFFS